MSPIRVLGAGPRTFSVTGVSPPNSPPCSDRWLLLVVSDSDPTVVEAVTRGSPEGITASSPGPGTNPVLQSLELNQSPILSIQVAVAIAQLLSACRVVIEAQAKRSAGANCATLRKRGPNV